MTTYFNFNPLRYKGPDTTNDVDTDDPDWHALQIPPNSGRYTAASVENGTFSITVSWARGGTVIATSSYEHAGSETAAETAEALADAINADIDAGTAGTLAAFAERAIYPGSGDLLYVQWKQGLGKDFYVATVAPGSATLTPLSGDRFPQTAKIPFGNRVGTGPNTDVELMVIALDNTGALLAPGTATYTLEVLDAYQLPEDQDSQWVVASRGTIAGTFGDVHGVQCNGSHQFGVRLSGITEPSNTDQIVVLYRTVVA